MKLEKACKSKIVKTVVSVMAIIVVSQFFVTIGINVTDSIPKKVFLIIKGTKPSVGDYVAFRFQGSRYYKKDKTFIKLFAGKEGDSVEVVDRLVTLNNKPVAIAKEKDREGRKIESFQYSGTIPPDKIFVMGVSKDSYDSRYFGFIDKNQVIGRAIALF